ncbi:MAG: hypothetical protein M3R11_09530 [Acidobacteriota bacterium]|nr:hypothetical protein [Acidobacteriota bacterium]
MKHADNKDKSPIPYAQAELEKPTLVFVYNADSGLFNLLTDIAHKIFSPQTYDCNLCAVTHDKFGIKDEWRQYLKTLAAPVEFLHADEFKAKYRTGDTEKLPAVFKKEDGQLNLAINSNAINACRNIDDLKRIINAQISEGV